MKEYINIESQLEALKIKKIEKNLYSQIRDDVNVIPKVTPFKGINTDLLYIKDDKLLFIKFMDTTEELFFILEDELIEVMNEEYNLMKLKMDQHYKNISYDYLFIMPYVEIDYKDKFTRNNIIDRNKVEEILDNSEVLDNYLKEMNNEIDFNLFLLDICPEYYVMNDRINLNPDFKKIKFYNDEYEYSATMLETSQINDVISIKYGNTLIESGSGTGKTTTLVSRAIKLARIYPHHNFVIFTYTKQLCNELREKLDILYQENNNLEVHTFRSFLFKLVKKYNLVVDYNMLKTDYEKTIKNIIKQINNTMKNKHMYKGIFIDESENYTKEQIEFIREFTYKTKFIMNIAHCNSLNLTNNMNIFKTTFEGIEFEEIISKEKNYRQSRELVNFTNKFIENCNEFIKEIRPNITKDVFPSTIPIVKGGKSVDIVKVSDIDEQINSIVWEIENLITQKGLKYSDIAVIYPYNKKKLKSGKTIYIQYIIRKKLDEANIPYICAEDDLTNITPKNGVTVSNIYSSRNLEYKAVILCELEVFYNHTINDKEQDYQVNDFVGDLNKLYLAINRCVDYLRIITTFSEESSDIIKLLMNSK